MAISITKPVVGGSQDTWGETLNQALDTLTDGVNGTSGTISPNLSTLKINGTDVTATANELNVMDGNTSATSTSVTGTDAIVYNDNGVMKQVTLNDINAFIQAQAGSAGNGTITITAGNALTGGGSFTTNQAGNTTVTVNHQDTSSQGSSNNSGNTFIQDITLDTYGHITGLGTATVGSVAGGGVPKNVYSTASNAALNINSVLNGDTLIMWHSDSSYIAVWDQAGWVGFNPSSTLLANFGNVRMAMWTNATGSTKDVKIQWNSGSTSHVYAFHYG